MYNLISSKLTHYIQVKKQTHYITRKKFKYSNSWIVDEEKMYGVLAALHITWVNLHADIDIIT